MLTHDASLGGHILTAMVGYAVERSATIAAPPQHLHGLVNDFHRWPAWSPWEDLDPDMRRSHTGPEQGAGARYSWSGNRKAGEGSMEVVGSTAEAIDIRLDFLKPFKSLGNQIRFSFTPDAAGTRVTWRMEGRHSGLMRVAGRFTNMDRLVGPDLEKGLARLRAAAESAPG